jgi:hypothetical protein
MKAMPAANWLKHEKRKHMLFKETARARTVRLPSVAFSAVEFAKHPSPPRWSKRRHDIPPAARVSILNPGMREISSATALVGATPEDGRSLPPPYTKVRRFC